MNADNKAGLFKTEKIVGNISMRNKVWVKCAVNNKIVSRGNLEERIDRIARIICADSYEAKRPE